MSLIDQEAVWITHTQNEQALTHWTRWKKLQATWTLLPRVASSVGQHIPDSHDPSGTKHKVEMFKENMKKPKTKGWPVCDSMRLSPEFRREISLRTVFCVGEVSSLSQFPDLQVTRESDGLHEICVCKTFFCFLWVGNMRANKLMIPCHDLWLEKTCVVLLLLCWTKQIPPVSSSKEKNRTTQVTAQTNLKLRGGFSTNDNESERHICQERILPETQQWHGVADPPALGNGDWGARAFSVKRANVPTFPCPCSEIRKHMGKQPPPHTQKFDVFWPRICFNCTCQVFSRDKHYLTNSSTGTVVLTDSFELAFVQLILHKQEDHFRYNWSLFQVNRLRRKQPGRQMAPLYLK